MGKPAKVPKAARRKRQAAHAGGSAYSPESNLVELHPKQPKASPSGKPKGQAAAMLALFEAHQGKRFARSTISRSSV